MKDGLGPIYQQRQFYCQRTPRPMTTALRRQVQWVRRLQSNKRARPLTRVKLSLGTELNLWERWHPVRPFMHWYNASIMNAYINKALEEGFEAYSQRPNQTSKKSIIDRSIQTFLDDVFDPSAPAQKTRSVDTASKELIVGRSNSSCV